MNRRDLLRSLAALSPPASMRAMAQDAPYILRVTTRQIAVKGRSARVFGLIGQDGRPGWAGRAGDGFAVRVVNELDEPTGIHWHGPTPPWRQDGVPGVSMTPIPAGGSQDFRFPLDVPGTHWMHSHLGLQKQALMTAPLIVRYAAPRDEQEVVVLLEDFSFTPADEILAKLLGGGMDAMPNAASPMPDAMTAGPTGAMGGMGGMGPVDRLRTLKAPGRRSAAAVDVNDIAYDAYLANERTLDDPDVIGIEGRARIRLRLINGAAATAFHLDLGEVVGTLVAVDGEDLAEPVRLSSMPLAVAQRADILLDLQPGTGAVPILFRREGARERTGVVLRPPGAPVRRLAELGDPAPPIGLDLEARLKGPARASPAARSVVVPLTGDMAAYRWGMGEVPPLRQGERIELELRNTTMMAHPMHLHGHRFQVVAINGRRMAGASRDTVLVPPMQTVTIGFDANNPGPWPFHCHHLYHQVRGMESVLRYA